MCVQVLHPLIAGNCHVVLLAAVSADSDNFLDTTNTLRLTCRMQTVTAHIVHNQSAELDLLPISQALPADVRHPAFQCVVMLIILLVGSDCAAIVVALGFCARMKIFELHYESGGTWHFVRWSTGDSAGFQPTMCEGREAVNGWQCSCAGSGGDTSRAAGPHASACR